MAEQRCKSRKRGELRDRSTGDFVKRRNLFEECIVESVPWYERDGERLWSRVEETVAKSPEVLCAEMRMRMGKDGHSVNTYWVLDPMQCSFALDSHRLWLF